MALTLIESLVPGHGKIGRLTAACKKHRQGSNKPFKPGEFQVLLAAGIDVPEDDLSAKARKLRGDLVEQAKGGLVRFLRDRL